jgi:heptosyltransferase-1
LNPKGRPKIDPSSLRKILLVRLRRIGDVVMTTPAVAALKAGVPSASLTYLIEKPYSRLVEGNPSLEKVLAIEQNQKGADFLGLIRKIRREKYDAVLDFHGGPRAWYLTAFSAARIKAGYGIKFRGFAYSIQISRGRPESPVHSVENHVEMVKALGIPVASIGPLELPPAREQEKKRMEEFFFQEGLKDSKLVVLHISAGNAFRDWGVDNIIELIGLLNQLKQVKVALVGSEEDRKAASEILKKTSPPPLTLVGRVNLIELRELIMRAKLFVGPDSGPMHIAASTSTPIVAYFGPTLPANFAPWQARAVILEKDLCCRPCEQRGCVSHDYRCLKTIASEEVFAACRNFLSVY